MLSKCLLAALTIVAAVAGEQSQNSSQLPIVDLGYQLQRATLFNSTGGYYNFSNIRYAQPPVGDLRFRKPLAPKGRNTTVDDGSIGRVCPQASPAWELTALTFDQDYLTGQPFNDTASKGPGGMAPAQDPRTTEDCLFLDLLVPQTVLQKAGSKPKSDCGAPVLVWIYGGGYTAGDKSAYNAAGLIKASQASSPEGLIFISINYRLGAFGWLAGPTLQSDGVANAALYDQRLSLQWIQKYVHLFGGDPKRVTVIGESAGGGSIMHQITAFGGLEGPAPFQQAILQSPGFVPMVSNYEQEQTFDAYLSLLNVTSLEEVRRLPLEALQKANIIQVGSSPYGTFTYGPVVDGLFAPAPPGKLLLQGSYDHNLKVMLGHNSDEGLLFTSPFVTNDTIFDKFVQLSFPTISPAVAAYIENDLYPPKMPGTLGLTGYTDEIGRVVLLLTEAVFTCNTYYLDRAYHNQTFAYQFSIPPGLHGQDIPYTFFNGANNIVVSDSTAVALQEYITSFAIKGAPSGPSLPSFPLYGNDSEIQDLNVTSITQIKDPVANARCLWWQKALYL